MNDEQLEQIASDTVMELIKDGNVVDGRWGGSKIYTRPDKTLIRAILKAIRNINAEQILEEDDV